MGEKGIAADLAGGLSASGTSGIVERTTTMVTSTVTDVGSDLGEAVRNKVIGAVADNAVTEARERLTQSDVPVQQGPAGAAPDPT
jgi:hypothetical protein